MTLQVTSWAVGGWGTLPLQMMWCWSWITDITLAVRRAPALQPTGTQRPSEGVRAGFLTQNKAPQIRPVQPGRCGFCSHPDTSKTSLHGCNLLSSRDSDLRAAVHRKISLNVCITRQKNDVELNVIFPGQLACHGGASATRRRSVPTRLSSRFHDCHGCTW